MSTAATGPPVASAAVQICLMRQLNFAVKLLSREREGRNVTRYSKVLLILYGKGYPFAQCCCPTYLSPCHKVYPLLLTECLDHEGEEDTMHDPGIKMPNTVWLFATKVRKGLF